METKIDIGGLNAQAAKEYLHGLLSTLKLTERQLQDINSEMTKWSSRIRLAAEKGEAKLAEDAEKELKALEAKWQRLALEADELKGQVEEARKQLPLLAARERSIDPDLLAQELLLACGRLPGDEEKQCVELRLREIEKEAAAEAELSQLKARAEHPTKFPAEKKD